MLNVCFNEYSIRYYAVDSKRELDSIFAQFYKENIVLAAQNLGKEVFLVSVSKNGHNNYWGIGILTVFSGLEPSIIPVPSSDYVIVGYDFNICLLDLNQKLIVFDYQLDSPFVFARVYSDGILVLSEMSVCVLGMDGSLRRSECFDDILEEYHFESDSLIFQTSSGMRKIVIV